MALRFKRFFGERKRPSAPSVQGARLGIVSGLFVAAISLLLTVSLYRLFRDVNRTAALAMLMFGLIDTPLYLINIVNDVAALSLAHGSALLGAFSGAQREGLTMLFLHLHGQMNVCSETFWGLCCSRWRGWCGTAAFCRVLLPFGSPSTVRRTSRSALPD